MIEVKDEVKEKLENEIQDARSKHNQLYRMMLNICRSKAFIAIINFSIIANTAVLALDKHPIDEQKVKLFENMNLGFAIVFAIEMFIKMLGLGMKSYFKDGFNTFDCAIVSTSTVDVVITYT